MFYCVAEHAVLRHLVGGATRGTRVAVGFHRLLHPLPACQVHRRHALLRSPPRTLDPRRGTPCARATQRVSYPAVVL